ncbi:MAG: hypothetical protein LQ341_003379 [Variospora aurantia]|nr:MAG: hypothetical protein LQ341_003379 [Variospora aurantia]
MASTPRKDLQPHSNEAAESVDEECPLLRESNEEEAAPVPKARKQRPVLILGTTFIGIFLGALDTTIIAALAVPISTSLGSLSLIPWVASAYIIANAACQPLLGRLTDIYGRRSGLIVSNTLFAIGNLICGLAASQGVMILGRAAAGLGGGGMLAISNFIASDLIPLRKRGLVQGIGNMVFGVGSGLGGLFGGFINDTWGWRVAFLIQVPFSLLSAILVYIVVAVPSEISESEEPKLSRVDFLGAFTLTTTLILLFLGLNFGGGSFGFGHPVVLVFFTLAALGLVTFILIEMRWAKEPIMPVQLMLRRTIAMGNLNNWFTLMVVFTVLVYTPIWFQVRGHSTTTAGLHLIPYSFSVSAGSLVAGFVMQRTGKYLVLGRGLVSLLVLGSGMLLVLDLSCPIWLATISLTMVGIGYGGIITVDLLATLSSVSQEYQAVIQSSIYLFRSTGSTIGVNVASAVYQHRLKSELYKRFGKEEGATRAIGKIMDSFDELDHLPARWRQDALFSCMDSLHTVFTVCLCFAIMALLCQIFVQQHKLHP